MIDLYFDFVYANVVNGENDNIVDEIIVDMEIERRITKFVKRKGRKAVIKDRLICNTNDCIYDQLRIGKVPKAIDIEEAQLLN